MPLFVMTFVYVRIYMETKRRLRERARMAQKLAKSVAKSQLQGGGGGGVNGENVSINGSLGAASGSAGDMTSSKCFRWFTRLCPEWITQVLIKNSAAAATAGVSSSVRISAGARKGECVEKSKISFENPSRIFSHSFSLSR